MEGSGPLRFGGVRHGKAGMARIVMVSSGEVWWGMAGEVSLGKDEQGVVWQARRVRDRSGMARQAWIG